MLLHERPAAKLGGPRPVNLLQARMLMCMLVLAAPAMPEP